MDLGLSLIATNLGVSIEYIVWIILAFGSLIFFAIDFKTGIILYFFANGLMFMLFHYNSMNFAPFIITTFISLVIMSIVFLFLERKQSSGAGII